MAKIGLLLVVLIVCVLALILLAAYARPQLEEFKTRQLEAEARIVEAQAVWAEADAEARVQINDRNKDFATIPTVSCISVLAVLVGGLMVGLVLFFSGRGLV
jgi:Tfp pilus assembly protein PilE